MSKIRIINDRCPLQGECGRKQCEYKLHERDCNYYQGNARPGAEIEDQQQAMEAEWEARMAAPSVLADTSTSAAPQEAEPVVVQGDTGSLVLLPVDKLHPHPDNPRKELGDLTELADSIKANGIYQNLTVIPLVDVDPDATIDLGDDHYTVIIGHRRLAAAKLAGLAEVPCVVTTMTEKDQVQTMLMENMQRSDLTVYEQAQGFQMMLDLGATVDEIAEKSGFSTATVRRRVKMMELDQAKLKDVSARQLSLGDFDTLAQIEDIKERNKVLDSIGTHDFNQRVASALRKQKEKHNLPLIKKWLKEVGAKEVKESDTYGSKYESYDGRYAINVSDWGEEKNKPPKVGKTQIYYVLTNYGTLRLFKKNEKAKREKKSPDEVAKTKAINETWDQLDAAFTIAHDLRKQFMKNLAITAKNRAAFLTGALTGALLEAIAYNSPNRSSINKILNIDSNAYGRERDQQLAVALDKLNDKDIPMLVYALFGDSGKMKCVKQDYRGTYPEYELNNKLNVLYNWLMSLGYEMSAEEKTLLDGTHELFHRGDPAPQADQEATQDE